MEHPENEPAPFADKANGCLPNVNHGSMERHEKMVPANRQAGGSTSLALAPRRAAGRQTGIATRHWQASLAGVRTGRQAEQPFDALALALRALNLFVSEHQSFEGMIAFFASKIE
jgi:hypothetical protein